MSPTILSQPINALRGAESQLVQQIQGASRAVDQIATSAVADSVGQLATSVGAARARLREAMATVSELLVGLATDIDKLADDMAADAVVSETPASQGKPPWHTINRILLTASVNGHHHEEASYAPSLAPSSDEDAPASTTTDGATPKLEDVPSPKRRRQKGGGQ